MVAAFAIGVLVTNSGWLQPPSTAEAIGMEPVAAKRSSPPAPEAVDPALRIDSDLAAFARRLETVKRPPKPAPPVPRTEANE